jgi:hypothetical protein
MVNYSAQNSGVRDLSHIYLLCPPFEWHKQTHDITSAEPSLAVYWPPYTVSSMNIMTSPARPTAQPDQGPVSLYFNTIVWTEKLLQ